LPSGHLEEGESVTGGAVREAGEEVGVAIDPSDLTFVHVVRYRAPGSEGRIGFLNAHDPTRHRGCLEFAETLQLIADWLAAGPATLGPFLLGYIGHPAYDPEALRADLDRFAFLLGGNDGENLLAGR
jgi:8-oxo-dGTP pyrophosphatase MutT (NUDIX family)